MFAVIFRILLVDGIKKKSLLVKHNTKGKKKKKRCASALTFL